MTEMLLLGAGASVEAGVPGAYEMTKQIISRIRARPGLHKEGHLLSFVAGGLLLEAGKANQDPFTAGVNVEDLFNAVQLLGERNALEAAPFVGAWHPMVEEFDTITPSHSDTSQVLQAIYRPIVEEIRRAFDRHASSFDARRIDEAVVAAVLSRGGGHGVGDAVERYLRETAKRWTDALQSGHPSNNSDLNAQMARLFQQLSARPARGQMFQRATELMTAELRNLVWIDKADRVGHLAPILNLLRAQTRLSVASLNYDNSIELLTLSRGVPCETGIEAWATGAEADFAKDGISLLKLHGSIDWTWEEGRPSKERPMPHRLVRQVEPAKVKDIVQRPCVIFGQRNKLTAEGPFLDLLRAFQRELVRADILTVVGYSFRDFHINVYISHWLNGDPRRVLRVVNGPQFQKDATGIEYGQILLRLKSLDKDRIQVVPEYARQGLVTLYGAHTPSAPVAAASA